MLDGVPKMPRTDAVVPMNRARAPDPATSVVDATETEDIIQLPVAGSTTSSTGHPLANLYPLVYIDVHGDSSVTFNQNVTR